MKYTEDTLEFWTSPLSKTEEQRVENTVLMIKDAIISYDKLSNCNIEVFAQGSYANNTNVRQNSDVDICVMLKSTFFCNYVNGKTDKDYGYIASSISYSDFKNYVIEALKAKFGSNVVTIGNKCINIKENSYHVNADVVPAFQYRDYKTIFSVDSTVYIEGIKFFTKNNIEIINYPKEHINNGKLKNTRLNYQYKKLVRIMKHIRNNMDDDGKANGDKITSFLIECLVWNLPDNIIKLQNTWKETIHNSITYLWNAINEGKHNEWVEVSKRLYLFHSERKWTPDETKDFLYSMFNYLELK